MSENRASVDARAPLMSAWLAGVALTSPDVHRLSQFYVDALGYAGQRTGASWRGALCARWLEIHEGSANALDHAVFAVAGDADLSGLIGRLRSAGVAIEEIEAAGMSARATIKTESSCN